MPEPNLSTLWFSPTAKESGIHKWRRELGYYQQSRVENTFYRYKTTLEKKLRSRREESRYVETVIGCNILNRFLEMGRCQSKMVLLKWNC